MSIARYSTHVGLKVAPCVEPLGFIKNHTQFVSQEGPRTSGNGGSSATAELFSLMYDQLRCKAAELTGRQREGRIHAPMVLVHEAFVKMVGGSAARWTSQRHFYHAACQAMRRILVDHARRESSAKRGGGLAWVSLNDFDPADPRGWTGGGRSTVDFEALDAALTKLRGVDERQYRVVTCRYFSGLAGEQIAKLLGITVKTVHRDWKTARRFLVAEMMGRDGAGASPW